MEKKHSIPPLRGIIPPVLTPLLDRRRLDVDGFERLIEHILAGGVNGMFFLGTTGEFCSLSQSLRMEVVKQVTRIVAGRVPILIGVTNTAYEELLELAFCAKEHGADAVVVAPPYSMVGAEIELRNYLQSLLGDLPLPVVLYSAPPLTKATFDLETVRWAIQQPNILGLKDSSGNLDYFKKVCGMMRERPDWSLLAGPEELVAETVKLGGHGGISGGANLFPDLYVRLYRAARDGDDERTRALQLKVEQVVGRLYSFGSHPSTVFKALKCAAAFMGICSEVVAPPFQQFDASTEAAVRTTLAELRELIERR